VTTPDSLSHDAAPTEFIDADETRSFDSSQIATRHSPIHLSREEARWLAVAAQRLDRRPPARRRRDKTLLIETIRAIGCLQLDTISVISRTHETVLWSRVGPYDPADLKALHYPDGELFEYWLHAAALAPIEFFPFMREYMAARAASDGWHRENREIMDRVLDTIRTHGPVSSRDFERPEGPAPEAWSWWGGKPERHALNFLWWHGELMVLKRDGFQRSYELTERVHPLAFEGLPPDDASHRRWIMAYAVSALGVATPAWAADYFRTSGQCHVPVRLALAELRAMAAEGLIAPVVADWTTDPVWIGHKEVALLGELRAGRKRPVLTTLLSPFDNLIWHRGRTASLFQFDYRIECYTPAPKRRYGYYSLSILHRGSLVGRLDPSYDRRARVLTIRSLHLEPIVRPTEQLAAAIAASLHDLLNFLRGPGHRNHHNRPARVWPGRATRHRDTRIRTERSRNAGANDSSSSSLTQPPVRGLRIVDFRQRGPIHLQVHRGALHTVDRPRWDIQVEVRPIRLPDEDVVRMHLANRPKDRPIERNDRDSDIDRRIALC